MFRKVSHPLPHYHLSPILVIFDGNMLLRRLEKAACVLIAMLAVAMAVRTLA